MSSRPRSGPRCTAVAAATTSGRAGAAATSSARTRPAQAGALARAAATAQAAGSPHAAGRIAAHLRWSLAALSSPPLALAGVGGCARAVRVAARSRAPPRHAAATSRRSSSTATARLLARLFAEQNRSDQPLQKMPATLRQAVIATEDQRFYEHAGVDPIGIARALVADVVLGEEVAGRLDHHAAVREERVRHAREDAQAQGRGGDARQRAREELHQGPDPRALPQHHLLRARCLRCGGGLAGLLRQERRASSTSPSPRCSPASSSRPAATPPTWTQGCAKHAARHRPRADARRRATSRRQQDAAAVAQPVKTVGLKSPAAAAPYFVEWVKDQLVKQLRRRTSCTAAA